MFELGADLELDLCNLDLIWSKDEMMLSGGGHELNQAGQDSLLEQMEAPWVNPINDEPTFSFSYLFQPPRTKFCPLVLMK